MAIAIGAQLAEIGSSEVPWANSAIGDEPKVTLEALQSGLTVRLIATNRADFKTCTRDELISAVVA